MTSPHTSTSRTILTIHPIVVQIDRSALGPLSSFEKGHRRRRRLPSHRPSRPLHPHPHSAYSLSLALSLYYQTLGVDAGFDSDLMALARRLFQPLSPRAPPKNHRARSRGDVAVAVGQLVGCCCCCWWHSHSHSQSGEQALREAGLAQVAGVGSNRRAQHENIGWKGTAVRV